MLAKDFEKLVEHENQESIKLMKIKSGEYSRPKDRIGNFKNAAGLRGTNPVDAAVGMVVKHWESISEMAKCPEAYTLEQWDAKLRDDRNYTYLIKACLLDMRS